MALLLFHISKKGLSQYINRFYLIASQRLQRAHDLWSAQVITIMMTGMICQLAVISRQHHCKSRLWLVLVSTAMLAPQLLPLAAL